MAREHKLIKRFVDQYDIDLTGLTVLTEAASGAYLHNPLIAAQAGAKVICVVKDSRFASAESVSSTLFDQADMLGLSNQVEVLNSLDESKLSSVDIVTNSGLVRPINRVFINNLKPTCVIPLMWETWEFRHTDFDIFACKEKGILCLGTDESVAPLSMDQYAGILSVRLLFELGLEVYKNNIALIGENKFAERIASYLELMGCTVHLFAEDELIVQGACQNIYPRNSFRNWFKVNGSTIDAVLVADLVSDDCLTNKNGLLEPEYIARINSDVKIGVLAGVIKYAEIESKNLACHPKIDTPAHFMSYQLYDIGPAPIMELFAAGLKVGEIMARLRLSGHNVLDTAKKSITSSPLVMDFEGDLSWV